MGNHIRVPNYLICHVDQVKSNAEPDIQHCGNGFPMRWT